MNKEKAKENALGCLATILLGSLLLAIPLGITSGNNFGYALALVGIIACVAVFPILRAFLALNGVTGGIGIVWFGFTDHVNLLVMVGGSLLFGIGLLLGSTLKDEY